MPSCLLRVELPFTLTSTRFRSFTSHSTLAVLSVSSHPQPCTCSLQFQRPPVPLLRARLEPARHPVTPTSHFIDKITAWTSVGNTTGRFRGTIMTRHAGRRQRPYDYDEPYNRLPRPQGASASPTKQDAQGWWVGGEWVEAPPGKSSQYDQRSRLSPIVIDDDDDTDCCEVPPPASRTSHTDRNVDAFDFNDGGQNVPWATSAHHGRRYDVSGSVETVRSLSLTATSHARSRTPLMMNSSCT